MKKDSKCNKDTLINITLLATYIITGALAPIILEYIKKQGGANGKTFLYAMPNSLAMAAVLLVPQKESKIQYIKKFYWQTIVMTLIDVVGTTLTLLGQILCGSGVYIIIYSSLTVWSALGSRFSMKKHFTLWQVIGIIIVTAGLGISGIASFNDGSNVIIGIVITLIGTIFHSCVYWLNEFFNFKYKLHMQIMCGYTGVFGVALYMVYQCAYTIPHWKQLVIDEIATNNGVVWQICLLYAALFLVDLFHMFAQYTVVPRVGSVSTGVGKSISSLSVFVFSHVLFCSVKKSQCIDFWKALSLIVVLCGVMTYTIAVVIKNRKSIQKAKFIELTSMRTEQVQEMGELNQENHMDVYEQEETVHLRKGSESHLRGDSNNDDSDN
ncbi:Conserved_hypothetical protein [Hexamita inflata]|uniref:Uncharacterized protein n=1 Tax=Hexamita inflata TaxID=28002 RepID=A0AA86UWS6_9EUKA|nr:Conserved hypothetical protein [Hexamita inflata]